jgi:hypothetical protein
MAYVTAMNPKSGSTVRLPHQSDSAVNIERLQATSPTDIFLFLSASGVVMESLWIPHELFIARSLGWVVSARGLVCVGAKALTGNGEVK